MSRYHVPNGNSSATGLSSGRETRAESSSLSSNFSQNSRRASASQLVAYKLKCEKEPLNSRLGPPDYQPQNFDCPEETFTKEYVQSGYKEMVEGLEEAREIMLSQVQAFSRSAIYRCKEAIRKRHRAIHESRAKKRKAGQVYGVPLSGSLLSKRGAFPEQRQCTEESRRRWIEILSQPHKRLRSLADNVPHGYRRKYLLEVLIKNNVPLLRATWFIKVNYLNQVRPGPSASGATDKNQLVRTEQWTKDVIEYLQYLLDEFSKKDSLPHPSQLRDRSSQMLHKSEPGSSTFEGEEPSVHFKWWYMVRLLQWHHSEGLLVPSAIIEWVLNQLQEGNLFESLYLLLPIIYGVIEAVVLSQTYVRILVGVALRFIHEPSPSGSYLVDNSRRAYTCAAVVEMLRYMIVAVPDTFVALDCFPLPSRVISHVLNDFSYLPKEASEKTEIAPSEVSYMFRRKKFDSLYQFASLDHFVSCIQKRSEKLAKSVSPGDPSCSFAKAVQVLDKALVEGDLRAAYRFLFEGFSEGAVDETWILEVNPSLRSSLKWIGTVDLVLIYIIFFLCEWAVSDFRNFRLGPLNGSKFTGRKDFSEVYTAIWFLRLKARDLRGQKSKKADSTVLSLDIDRVERKRLNFSDIFESPGPIHDVLVCWIDQHDAHKGEGLERMQLFLVELTRFGIFYPQAYARQLLVSGILDSKTEANASKHMRHRHILKVLPEDLVHDSLKEMKCADGAELAEATHVYSNERQLIIQEYYSNRSSTHAKFSTTKQNYHQREWKSVESPSDVLSFKKIKSAVHVDELKTAISVLMQFPYSNSMSMDTVMDESDEIVKRSGGSTCSEVVEGTSGCEECRRVKKQKLTENRSLYIQVHPIEEEDLWWAQKDPLPKQTELLKIEPPLKSVKQNSRGRRKTQSLAQLAAARIEGSQGVSTSHVCDSRLICPHHRSGSESEFPKAGDGIGPSPQYSDIISIGKALKRLRFAKRRAVASWLVSVVRQHVEEAEKVKIGQLNNRAYTPLDDGNPSKWKLTEEELSSILYLLDVSNDLLSALKFVLWLLPRALRVQNTAFHSGRNMALQKQMENHVCEIGEAVVLSSLRRYEPMLIASDLIPQALSTLVQRAASAVTSSGRVFGTPSLAYARYLLKKYGNVNSVLEWRKNFKATCDKRLFSELESSRLLDGDYGYSLGVPSGIDDADDFLRQKLSSGRISRVGMNMRDIVQRNIEDAVHILSGKDKKGVGTNEQQIAQQIVDPIVNCMKQTGGAAQEGDPCLVSSAVSAVVGSVGPTLVKIPDFAGASFLAGSGPLSLARRILQIHISCLCLLKEALDDRQSRAFEVALAMEASSAISGIFSPGKMSRNQYQMSPEPHDPSESTDSTKSAPTRSTKIAAAVSALVIGAVLQGFTSLERIVTVFRLKEGLDVIQFVRSTRSSSNGSMRNLKGDGLVEIYVHWFRVLIGNCRTVSDGLIVDLLGEPSVLALSRMQQSLPLGLVFPAAYSIFAFLTWKPFIYNVTARDDMHQLYQSLTVAIHDALSHHPFRDICLRSTIDLYEIIAEDTTDAEFAAMVESDPHSKSTAAFFPLRARLFLGALIDCRISSEDSGRKSARPETETKLVDKIIHVLNTLQPARFHWQWLELRLLLNEQAILEKLENHDVLLADALRSLSSLSSNRSSASENESNFIEIILTRLLVRPDAAPLYSEVVHLFGRSLEDSLLLLTKWFLEGNDVLLGRKTVRQRLMNIAGNKGLSTTSQSYKHWGWSSSGSDTPTDTKKLNNLEEGEVVEEGVSESKKSTKASSSPSPSQVSDAEHNYRIEKALVELVLPCMDQSSVESRNTFASDLIKQLNVIEQQMSAITRVGTTKHSGTAVAADGPMTKSSSRKGSRGGSPSLARRQTAVIDANPPSPAALRASVILRLHFLLRLLPVICTDREPLGRNLRHMLASVMLRLLGNRYIYEDAELSFHLGQSFVQKKEGESAAEISSAASPHLSGESLFDRLLLILHGLLGSSQPSWLKSKIAQDSSKDFSPVDKEVVETLQNELETMQLPDKIRWRIQSAMPVLLPSVRCSISCEPSPVPPTALAILNPTQPHTGISNPTQRNPARTSTSSLTKSKSNSTPPPPPETDSEFDPWTLLEDGVGSVLTSGNVSAIGSGDDSVRASSWLKGAVRVRRTDLLYVNVVDDDNC